MYVLLASLTIAVLSASQAVPLDIDSRIVNGTDVNIRDYPYMVSLQYDGRHLCGGSIIDKNNILTAAHCVATRDLEGFTVLPGSTIVTYGTFMLIERIIVHSGYTGLKPYRNDIAIVHLAQPLEFSERVKPIQLPKVFEAIPEFSEATLTGWGYHMGDSGGPLVVNGIQIGIVSWSKKPCTLAGYPGVFARVSTYIDWIQCNLKRV
ncbi:chymotrypsin-1 isoform X2 [Anoplophora glabripennis]|uniref:chymotrypsin-1 isoform X2 n=1 Tax=Anoplophora glabripennis TaxID=217634 RepID=UPI0008744370|nr:chymotrypsin-1 isoform X2 [Anoplophora glabripennis]